MSSAQKQQVWFSKQGVLLIGYDVELGGFIPAQGREHYETDKFMVAAAAVHRELGAPCTLFICGATLDKYPQAFVPVAGDPLFEFGQHTYSHLLLKSVVTQSAAGGFGYHPHACMDVLTGDIERAQKTISSFTGKRPIGFCGPWGYAIGLYDRWDLVRMLYEAGIRYCRTYARRMDGTDLNNLAVPPFWYSVQGYPDVLEIPVGEPCDVHVRPRLYPTVKAYSERLDRVLEEVARDNRVFSYTAHDWSAPVGDPELNYIRRLITRARELGIDLMTHGEYYRQCLSCKART